MADYCTCGVELPPDARFCHKCGKPQRDEPLFAAEPIPLTINSPVEGSRTLLSPAVAPASAAPVTGISFRNPAVLRVALVAAFVVSILCSFPLPVYVQVFWEIVLLLGGGFFSVYLYGRRTGQQVSVRGGAQIGWITGIFCFAIMMVLFALSVAYPTGDGLQVMTREALARAGPEFSLEVNRIVNSPSAMASFWLAGLIFAFFLFTLVPALGGALGAKVLEND